MDHSEHQNGKMDMGQAGHDHHQMMIADFRKRFWVTLVLTVPVLYDLPKNPQVFSLWDVRHK